MEKEINGKQKRKNTIIPPDRLQYKGTTGVVDISTPYVVRVLITGTETMLCHRYDVEVVKEKGGAKKGSADKKTDNIESYLYRLPNGNCGMPGLNFKASICMAAKFSQDPRSPRKSAYDLFRAGIKAISDADLGKATWDFLDKRKVNVQRNGITRTRPAFLAGWTCEFLIRVLLPEYITPDLLHEVIVRAGQLCGLGDFRPDFGTYRVDLFEVIKEHPVLME